MRSPTLAIAFTSGLIASLRAEEPASADNAKPLVQWIVQHGKELDSLPFPDVVEAASGRRVIPFDPVRDEKLLGSLSVALDAAVAALNDPKHPVHLAERVNEASRPVEDELLAQIRLLPGWKCAIPQTAEGRAQRSGYPDLRVETDTGRVLYLDPKLHKAGNRTSSLRSFYYEPRNLTGKIQDDAIHLIVGVEYEGADTETLRIDKWELIDASKLRVRLKAEFQASNADIYRDEAIVGRSAK